jgi:TATA-box binding protein (TBP) (component of TFIID and TFIIIB)
MNKKTILISAILSAMAALNSGAAIGQIQLANNDLPDELFYDVDETVQVVLTPDKCRYEPELFSGRIINRQTADSLYVCWFPQGDVVHIQGVEGANVYDYTYYIKRFQPRWY